MKRKLFLITVGLIIFAGCFLTSVLIRDYVYEQHLRTNISKVKVGMTEKEVIEILGKPSNIWMTDGSAQPWCYNTNSITEVFEPQPEITCRHLLLRMNGTVKEVYDFDS